MFYDIYNSLLFRFQSLQQKQPLSAENYPELCFIFFQYPCLRFQVKSCRLRINFGKNRFRMTFNVYINLSS